MGTTFHAQIEVRCGDWQSLSRWELQKDYAFARAFYSVARDRWPDDADSIIGEEDIERELFDRKRHAAGIAVEKLVPVDDIEWFHWAYALRSHVSSLVLGGYDVRVLWWEM